MQRVFHPANLLPTSTKNNAQRTHIDNEKCNEPIVMKHQLLGWRIEIAEHR